MNYGQRFKYYRVKADMTQKEAAAIIGVNDYQLGNYETNRSEPSIDVLKKMSETYHVSIDKMLGNNWMKKDIEHVVEEEYVDMDSLLKQLSSIVDQMNNANKK